MPLVAYEAASQSQSGQRDPHNIGNSKEGLRSMTQAHRIVHVDIPAQDPPALSRFYADLFGWQVHPLPTMAYTRFQAPDGVTGGFVELGGPEQHRTGELLVYVDSDDIDGDVRKAIELGAKVVMPKTEIPRTGWFALLEDPAGNRFGLFHRTGYVAE
jgi:predicted enzyme related to lactoylglutathione lyase